MSNQNYPEERGPYPSTDVEESRMEGVTDAGAMIAGREEAEMPSQQTSPFVKPFHFIQVDEEEKQ